MGLMVKHCISLILEIMVFSCMLMRGPLSGAKSIFRTKDLMWPFGYHLPKPPRVSGIRTLMDDSEGWEKKFVVSWDVPCCGDQTVFEYYLDGGGVVTDVVAINRKYTRGSHTFWYSAATDLFEGATSLWVHHEVSSPWRTRAGDRVEVQVSQEANHISPWRTECARSAKRGRWG